MTKRAIELNSNGFTTGQIADELNVSIDTATWLLLGSQKEVSSPVPKDISVNWSSLGVRASRLRFTAMALTDMIFEVPEADDIDTVIGIATSGIPVATMMAEEMDAEFAVYHGKKGRNNGSDSRKGFLSRNFSGDIKGKKCVIIDDVITTGTTINNVIDVLKQAGASPVAIGVLVDKQGFEALSDVPVKSIMKIRRLD